VVIRQPIITVLGHVDHGKTKLLDRIRGTGIAEKEAGAITQHIGATEVPIQVIENLSGKLMKQFGFDVKIPGLLFIDTPGHEAFTSLRTRGGSIADLAVLAIDITQLAQPQTIEAIEILKSFKTPFIVAANKIDLIQSWDSKEGSFLENLKNQNEKGEKELDEKIYRLVGQLHEKGILSERFDRCNDFSKQISIVPVSAMTGEGIPELLMLLSGLSQKFLEKNLEIHENSAGKGTVLEVKEERGLGKTVDVILYDGVINVGDEIVLGGSRGIIKTKVRALLKPKPMEEIRDPKEKFNHFKQVGAASGLKIAAPDLENALAGSPISVIKTGEEEKEIEEEIKNVKIDLEQEIGPVVKADTLGSLEACIKLLEGSNFKVKTADIGNVSKRDVMEALTVKKKDELMGVLFAFNVSVDDNAKEEAKLHKIKIFKGDVIYKLIEDYEKWVNDKRDAKKKEKLELLTMPARLELIPGFVFRNSKPAVVGVKVSEGKIKPGTTVMTNKIIVGKITGLQKENESISEGKKGEEIAVSIDKAVFGRNLEEGNVLYSFVPEDQFEELKKDGILNSEELELLEEIQSIEKNIVEKDLEEEL